MSPRTALGVIALLMVVTAASAQPVRAQQQTDFSVIYEVSLDQHFGIYSGTTQHIDMTIAGHPGTTNGSLVVKVFFEFVFQDTRGLPHGATTSIRIVHQSPLVSELTVTFPPGTESFSFRVLGETHDTSVAYRGSATLTYATVFMNAPPFSPTSYQVLIPTSPRIQIISVFPGTGPGLTTQYVNINGTSYLATGFSFLACFVSSCSVQVGAGTISILYQPAYFNYFIAVYLLFVVGALAAIGLVLRERSRSVIRALDWVRIKATAVLRSIDSKKILAALVIVGVLMISLAVVFGPSPSPRAYLAATPGTTQILTPYVTGAGFTYLAPRDAADEFDVMSSLNSFYTVIVADYPPQLQNTGLLSASRIVVVEPYANSTLVKNLQTYFGQEVTVVNSPQQLQFDLALAKNSYTSNYLGLQVSPSMYSIVTGVEGLLSLTIPFFALAFFARYMVESSSRGITKLAQGAAFSFFVFMFGELVFIQTDVLLTLPVALHATISSQETALGALGFGGGSRPRMVMGILGFLLGGFAGALKGTKVDRVVLIGAISTLLFLLADPLQLGQDFYNVVLQITTSEGGTAFGQAAFEQLRSFIFVFQSAFGNEVIPTFFSQHGAVVFFAGAVPFALYTYVRRSTATLLLLFSSVVAAVGYVRIGDQDPLKAIASTTPGFALAVVFVLMFLVSDRMERFLRLKLGLA